MWYGWPGILLCKRWLAAGLWRGKAASSNTLSRFEPEVLVAEENLRGLEQLNTQWADHAMARTPHQRVILDMDSSESPVYGEQEGAVYNGHFEALCYHPPFLFNEFGDCEGVMLRLGSVPSAERWRQVLEPIVERYRKTGGGCCSGLMLPLPSRRYTNTWSHETSDTLSDFPPTRYCRSISSIY